MGRILNVPKQKLGPPATQGFGFVELADGSRHAFLHVSVVERSGHGNVPPGSTLDSRCVPGPDRRGRR